MMKDRLPRTEAINEYHRALDTAKAQIDLIVRNNTMPFAWLDELQRYLNKVRIDVAETAYNRERPYYEQD